MLCTYVFSKWMYLFGWCHMTCSLSTVCGVSECETELDCCFLHHIILLAFLSPSYSVYSKWPDSFRNRITRSISHGALCWVIPWTEASDVYPSLNFPCCKCYFSKERNYCLVGVLDKPFNSQIEVIITYDLSTVEAWLHLQPYQPSGKPFLDSDPQRFYHCPQQIL